MSEWQDIGSLPPDKWVVLEVDDGEDGSGVAIGRRRPQRDVGNCCVYEFQIIDTDTYYDGPTPDRLDTDLLPEDRVFRWREFPA